MMLRMCAARGWWSIRPTDYPRGTMRLLGYKKNPGRSRGKCAGDLVTAGICRGQELCDTRPKGYRERAKRPAQCKRNARRSGRAKMEPAGRFNALPRPLSPATLR